MGFGAPRASLAAPGEVVGAARHGATPSCAGARRCASTSSCARATSATSSRAAPWTPSTSGSSSRRGRPGPRAVAQRVASQDGGRGPVEPVGALLPQRHARRARQPHRQAQRLGDALGGLRAPRSAGRRRHGALSARRAGRRRASRIHASRKVNYRKFAWWNTQWSFAGVRDPRAHGFLGSRPGTTTALGVHRATRPRYRVRSRTSPTFPSR